MDLSCLQWAVSGWQRLNLRSKSPSKQIIYGNANLISGGSGITHAAPLPPLQNEVLQVWGVVDGHQLHGLLQVLPLNTSQWVARQRQHHLAQRHEVCLLRNKNTNINEPVAFWKVFNDMLIVRGWETAPLLCIFMCSVPGTVALGQDDWFDCCQRSRHQTHRHSSPVTCRDNRKGHYHHQQLMCTSERTTTGLWKKEV